MSDLLLMAEADNIGLISKIKKYFLREDQKKVKQKYTGIALHSFSLKTRIMGGFIFYQDQM
jgi:hypothetical protein